MSSNENESKKLRIIEIKDPLLQCTLLDGLSRKELHNKHPDRDGRRVTIASTSAHSVIVFDFIATEMQIEKAWYKKYKDDLLLQVKSYADVLKRLDISAEKMERYNKLANKIKEVLKGDDQILKKPLSDLEDALNSTFAKLVLETNTLKL